MIPPNPKRGFPVSLHQTGSPEPLEISGVWRLELRTPSGQPIRFELDEAGETVVLSNPVGPIDHSIQPGREGLRTEDPPRRSAPR